MNMIAIIDYNAGNLTSVKLSLGAIGAEGIVTSSPEIIRKADHVIFPGVGAAASAMAHLKGLGLDTTIRETIASGTPFLGICLGTQILFDSSEEDGGTEMLGILSGTVKRFQPVSSRDKVPHMGWNQVAYPRLHPAFEGIPEGSDFYFVHSYYPCPADDQDSICKTEFADTVFTSAVARGNIVATQFHIEKSGKAGLKVLSNFLKWDGKEPASC